jgi:hypothetical protein
LTKRIVRLVCSLFLAIVILSRTSGVFAADDAAGPAGAERGSPNPQSQPSGSSQPSLLETISSSRWCTSRRSYSLQFNGDSIIWRDNNGSTDEESMVYDHSSEAKNHHPEIHSSGERECAAWNDMALFL